MIIEEALTDFITSQPEITQLIGDRFRHMALPQGTSLPAITYMRISNTRQRHHGGISKKSPVYQLSCFSKDSKEVEILAQKVINALDMYSGQMGTFERVDSLHENDRSLYDPETGIFHVPIDVEVNYD